MSSQFEIIIDEDGSYKIHHGGNVSTIKRGDFVVTNSQATANGKGFGHSVFTASIGTGSAPLNISAHGSAQFIMDLRSLLYGFQILDAASSNNAFSIPCDEPGRLSVWRCSGGGE